MRRRRLVPFAAGGATAGIAAFAGCFDDGSLSVEEFPLVDEWLTESEVGDPPLHLEPHRGHGMKGGLAVTE